MTGYQQKTIHLQDLKLFRRKLAGFIGVVNHVVYLDSNSYTDDPYSKYDLLLGTDPIKELTFLEKTEEDPFDLWQNWLDPNTFSMGFLSYDLKNALENLSSDNPTLVNFPLLHFFEPGNLLLLRGNELTIYSKNNPNEFWERIDVVQENPDAESGRFINLKEHPSKAVYEETVEKIRTHILDGDVYELNYCRFFESDVEALNQTALISNLMESTAAPFSNIVKWNGKLLFSGSPERFLCKRGNKIISQPIKGTIRRGADPEEDQTLKTALLHSEKDQAENIMIVDLVRNDLSRSCNSGSVKVEELFGIYSFKTVNHMVSTVSGQLKQDVHPLNAIKYAFPMGSMTGAPKIISMELIEQYENFKRGLFSGSVGYIDSEGDFDFNVVIRSILIDQNAGKAFIPVGGAIVFDSEPEKEYQESLLKAQKLLKTLGFDDNSK